MHTLSHHAWKTGGKEVLLLVLIKEGRQLWEDEIRPDCRAPARVMSLRFIATHQWKCTDPAHPIFLNHSVEAADCLWEQQSLTQHPACCEASSAVGPFAVQELLPPLFPLSLHGARPLRERADVHSAWRCSEGDGAGQCLDSSCSEGPGEGSPNKKRVTGHEEVGGDVLGHPYQVLGCLRTQSHST